MKLLLLPALFMCCLFASSQNQLIRVTEFDNFPGIISNVNETYTDYIYNEQDEVLYGFNHDIRFDYEIGEYVLNLPWELIQPDTTHQYFSYTNPDSNDIITAYTYVNNLKVQTESFPYRTLFTYTSNNKEQSITKQFFDGAQYKTIDSIAKTHTSSNFLQTKHQYTNYNDTLRLMNVDTLIYNQTNNKLEQFYHWEFSTAGTILEATRKDYYSTNNIDSIDYFTFDTITLNYNWTQRKCYYNNTPGYSDFNYKIYNVVSNQLEANPIFSNSNYYSGVFQIFDTLYGVETSYLESGNTFLNNIEYLFITQYSWDESMIKDHYFFCEYNGVDQLIEFPNIQANTIPNPATDVVTIKTETPIISLKLLTLTGQVILEQTSAEIDLNGLPAGTYLVTGQTERGNFNEKIIKQ